MEKNNDEVLDILVEHECTLFAVGSTSTGILKIGIEDICIYEEYVLALEKKLKLKKENVSSHYRGHDTH